MRVFPFPALLLAIYASTAPFATAQTHEDKLAIARMHLAQSFHHLAIEADSITTAELIVDDLIAKGHDITDEQRNQIVDLFRMVMAEETRKMLLSFDQILADYFTYDELVALRNYEISPTGDRARQRLSIVMSQASAQVLSSATRNFPDLEPQLAEILGVEAARKLAPELSGDAPEPEPVD